MPSRIPFPKARRDRVIAVGIVVVLVVVLSGWVTWRLLSERAADKVSAAWSLDCTGTKLAVRDDGPVIRSRAGWRCDVALTMTNEGGRSVHVREIEGDYMGTEGGAEVQGFSTPDAEIHDAESEMTAAGLGDSHAVWDVDTTIPAGSSRTVHLAIGWRKQGCNSVGHLEFLEWPTVVFDVWGRTHRASPQQSLTLRTYDDAHDEAACAD